MCASKQKPAVLSLNSGFVRGLAGWERGQREWGVGNGELGKGSKQKPAPLSLNSGFVRGDTENGEWDMGYEEGEIGKMENEE